MKKLTLKNISGRKINVFSKAREVNEIFEVEIPKTNKWTSETYLLSKPQEISNLIEHKYVEVVNNDATIETETDSEKREQLMLREYGFVNPVRSEKV
jgi:hypothetical protein